MSAVRLSTTAESASAMTLTFTRNPAHPRSVSVASPMLLNYRAADGTPLQQEFGKVADIELRWTGATPMTATDFADLLTFFRYCRGGQDQITYRDEDGTDHDAFITDNLDNFTQAPNGFAGSLSLRIRS